MDLSKIYDSFPSASTFAIKAASAVNGWINSTIEETSILTVVMVVFLGAVAYDQYSYLSRKGSIAGPVFKIPFMGPFLQSVDPQFHEYQEKWNSGALSCVSVFHKFVVIASTRDMARKIFNAPIQALELYLPGQEEVDEKYFETFVDITSAGNAVPFMPYFRELMCALSCRTFVGNYMPEETIKSIADSYYKITAALELVNFPIILPFTRTWYGKKCADMVLEEFAKCAAKAKSHMRAGGEIGCIMDAWIKHMIVSEEYRRKLAETPETAPGKPDTLIRWFTDMEISMTVFTFLFASQDASSSACTWLFQLMAEHPRVLDRVREENMNVRGGDQDKRLTMHMMDKMTYTRAVVKETLRYRPPVLMVPYIAKKNFAITDDYTIPKGSMVVPATYPALHDPEAYPNPDAFDPERWISGDAEQQGKNWLVFGTGPHYCIGQNFAILNLMALIGKASMRLNWKHHITPDSEKIKIFATIFPKDDCLLSFEKRD